jgi:hypothetical protein
LSPPGNQVAINQLSDGKRVERRVESCALAPCTSMPTGLPRIGQTIGFFVRIEIAFIYYHTNILKPSSTAGFRRFWGNPDINMALPAATKLNKIGTICGATGSTYVRV